MKQINSMGITTLNFTVEQNNICFIDDNMNKVRNVN